MGERREQQPKPCSLHAALLIFTPVPTSRAAVSQAPYRGLGTSSSPAPCMAAAPCSLHPNSLPVYASTPPSPLAPPIPVRRAVRSALLTMLKHDTAAHASGASPGCGDPCREPPALPAKCSFSGAGSSLRGGQNWYQGTLPAQGCVPHPQHHHGCFNMLLLSICFSIVNSTWEI